MLMKMFRLFFLLLTLSKTSFGEGLDLSEWIRSPRQLGEDSSGDFKRWDGREASDAGLT